MAIKKKEKEPAKLITAGRWEGLEVQGDSGEESDPPLSPVTSVSPTPPTPLSKKAKARRRAKERALKAENGEEDISSSVEIVQPITPPPLSAEPPKSSLSAPSTSTVPQPLPKDTVLSTPTPANETDDESDVMEGDGIDSTDDEAEAVPTILSIPPSSGVEITPRASSFNSNDIKNDGLTPTSSNVRTPTLPTHSLGNRLPSPSPKKEQNLGADHSGSSSARIQAIITRTVWSLAMIGGFILLLLLGHGWMVMLIFAVQTAVYRELNNLFGKAYDGTASGVGKELDEKKVLRREERRKQSDAWGRLTSWYFFGVANYFFYGESIIKYFKHIVLVDAYLLPFAQHHRFISLMLYVIGFVSFVGSLKRGQLRRQFGLFCWIHMTLLFIVTCSHFIVNNILEGLIWFWVPASLVIMNDISAYVFGMLFGRTQLIKLSPKKTVEGFVGAFFATIVFSYFWATFFMRFNYLICPVRDFSQNAFSEVDCTPNPVFLWHQFPLPEHLASFASTVMRREVKDFYWAPFQIHAIVLAIFASLVAPFGGFFASGFKRAFNIKDFGDSIPGHGGLTDRMDCQFLMGLFSYVYYSSLIRVQHVSVGSVLGTIINGLSMEDQVELYHDLQKYLKGQGISY